MDIREKGRSASVGQDDIMMMADARDERQLKSPIQSIAQGNS